MTIQSETRISGPFVGDGSTVNLDFDYVVFEPDDVTVITRDADGVDTILVLTTDYGVTLNADQDVSPGGRVTLVTALADGLTAYVDSNVDYLQEQVFTNSGGFYPAVLNTALDKIHAMVLQLKEGLGRTFQVPAGESGSVLPSATNRANKAFGFDTSGNAIAISSDADAVAASISALESSQAALEAATAALTAGFAVYGDLKSLTINPDGLTVTAEFLGFKDGGTSNPDPDGTVMGFIDVVDISHALSGDSVVSTQKNRVVIITKDDRDLHPNVGPIDIEDSVGMSRRFRLSEPICAKATTGFGNSGELPAITVASGFYVDDGVDGSGDSNNARYVSCANLSTRSYDINKPMCRIAHPAYSRLSGASNDIECQVSSIWGYEGRPVAVLELIVTDSAGGTASAMSTVVTRSTASKAAGAPAAQVMVPSIDVSGLTDGEGTARLKGYSWIGDCIFDTDPTADGATWELSSVGDDKTPNPSNKPVVIDNAGNYTPLYAAYDPSTGDDSTAVVSTTQATAEADPFATIAALKTAAQAENSASRSHDDMGMVHVVLMEDISGFGSNISAWDAGLGRVFFIPNSGAASRARKIQNGTHKITPMQSQITGIEIEATDGDAIRGSNDTTGATVGTAPEWYIVLDDCYVNRSGTGTTSGIYNMGVIEAYGTDWDSNIAAGYVPVNSRMHYAYLHQCDTRSSYSGGVYVDAYSFNGCRFDNVAPSTRNSPTLTRAQTPDYVMFQNFECYNLEKPCLIADNNGVEWHGLAVENFIVESLRASGSTMTCSTEGTVDSIVNAYFRNGTFAGGKCNIGYAVDVPPIGTKEISFQCVVFSNFNNKGDYFAVVNEGRTATDANWWVRFGVLSWGVVIGTCENGTTDSNSSSSWALDFPGLNAEVFQTLTYTDDASWGNGTTGFGDSSGNGDYTVIAGTAAALNKSPAGRQAWPEDVQSNTWRADGTGGTGGLEVAIS